MARYAAAQGAGRSDKSGAREVGTLAVVSGAHLVSHLHMMVLPVLLHLLKDRVDSGYLKLGLAVTAFYVVTGLTQAPMGVLVDRIGGRAVLIAGLLLGGAAFALMGAIHSYTWLVVAAVVGGLANCVYHPADYAILNAAISERAIGRAFAVHTFAGFAGMAIAPPMLLGVVDRAGLGAAFIAAGACAWAVAAVAILAPSTVSAAQGSRAGSGSGAKSAAKSASGSLLEVLTPTVLGLVVFFTLLGLSGSAMSTFAIPALIAGHGVSEDVASVALTAYLSASAVGVLAGGPLADRTSRHGVVAAVSFLVSAVLALAIAVAPLPAPLLATAMALTGFLFGVVQPARDMLVRKAAPPGAAGRVFGIVSTGFNIGGIVGPALFGFLMEQGAPRWIFGSAVVFMLATGVLGLLEERRGQAQPETARA